MLEEIFWTILEKDKSKSGYVKCRCHCGVIKSIYLQNIRSGKSKSCGCRNNLKINSGDYFGQLTALHKDNTQGQNRWFFQCDCGNIINTTASTVMNGDKKSCGCYTQKGKHKNKFSNKKFGKLSIFELDSRKSNTKAKYYKYKCDCGKEGSIISTSIGKSYSCGCVRDSKDFYNEISGTHYGNIKYNAEYGRKRKIDFSVSKEYLWDLYIKQNRKCAISNIEIVFGRNKRRDITTASLDRIDSNKGYIEGNVQWVHKYLNMMKRTCENFEFIQWFDEAAECYIKHKREQEQNDND